MGMTSSLLDALADKKSSRLGGRKSSPVACHPLNAGHAPSQVARLVFPVSLNPVRCSKVLLIHQFSLRKQQNEQLAGGRGYSRFLQHSQKTTTSENTKNSTGENSEIG
ncbi:Hypothetical predicted protein [Cloeon dipterum]|uniref:Uncharacterized protein n=1 Tax=Cloeon dipterum TaxID=197152 RepID=A0A8S1E1I1_9INSE|nr:Hypothetical predicted protein [Cloeon dipterum]